MVTFICESCEKKLNVKDELSGKRIKAIGKDEFTCRVGV